MYFTRSLIYPPYPPIVASRRNALLEKDPRSFHSFVTLSQRCPLLCEFILAKKKHGLLHSLTINAASSRQSHEHKKVANFCRYIWEIFVIFINAFGTRWHALITSFCQQEAWQNPAETSFFRSFVDVAVLLQGQSSGVPARW